MTTTYIDYPFTANGINFISRIYDNFHLAKEIQNIKKRGVDVETAKQVFRDPKRIIAVDEAHGSL